MIEILPAPPHVAAYRFSGTVDGDEYDRVLESVEAKLKANPKIGLYADMTGFHDMTGAALAKDFQYNLSKLGQWSRFPRMALVTDKQWLKTLVKTIDPIFPQFDARTFDPGQEAEAMAFASELRS